MDKVSSFWVTKARSVFDLYQKPLHDMKKLYQSLSRRLSLLGLMLILIMASACSKKDAPKPPIDPPAAAPTVTSLDIREGAANTLVTITGTNFSTTASNDLVYFNGTQATIQSATETQLTVTVPAAGSSGEVTLKVKGVPLSGGTFTYLPALAISSLSLSESGYGLDITITGTGFASQGFTFNEAVYFNGKLAKITKGTNTAITATVPLGAGTGPVSVKFNKVTAIGPVFTYDLTAVVTTFSGSGVSFYGDGSATVATFTEPSNIAIDANGVFYTADTHNATIRKISADGTVITIAGTPAAQGFADGTGKDARFFGPEAVAVDASGNVFVADFGNNAIRKITSVGVVSTFAGSGLPGHADAVGANASFTSPSGIAVGKSGTIYVVDAGSNRIRKINPVNGAVVTMAGSGAEGSTDGIGKAASFNTPWGIALDANENLYVTDNRSRIRKITPAGVVSTLAGGTTSGKADGKGSAARFDHPYGLAMGPDGNLYVADGVNNQIRKVTPDGTVTTYAGTGLQRGDNGDAQSASFYLPGGIVFDAAGAMYIADDGNNVIRKITLQ
ncbi:MAG: IPT/TIG domain-containing protein [Mucilaginibacter sp.]